MEELKFIVESLKRPPFSKDLTLVTFDEKTPQQLLQVVNDVFAELDESHRIDLRDEAFEDTSYRMMDFMILLNYKHVDKLPTETLQERFMAGDHSVIYPFLNWMLHRVPELKKRAYLARYLRRLEIPTEILASDQSIVSSNEELKQLQSQFMETHKLLSKLRRSTIDPSQTRRNIEQLKQEKSQLQVRLSKMRQKVESEAQFQNVDFASILSQTSSLRGRQEDYSAVYERLQEQRQLLARSESKYAILHRRLSQMKQTQAENALPQTILERLRGEVASNRQLVDTKLEMEYRDLEKKVTDLERILKQDTMTEDQVEELERNIQSLEDDVHVLADAQRQLHERTNDQLGFFRTQAAAMAHKKETILKSLEESERDKEDLQRELMDLETELGDNGGSQPRTEEDIKRYMKELQQKSQRYKECKAKLQGTRNEIAVLIRTEEILRSRDENLSELLQELAANNGVSGYLNAQQTLEKVSVKKSAIDADKGATLEEMSAVVNRLMSELQGKKTELAPKIKSLRELRGEFKAIESVYLERKQAWDNVSVGLENSRMQLDNELNENCTGYSREESQYHLLNCLSMLERARESRLKTEKALQQGSSKGEMKVMDGKYESYRTMYEGEAAALGQQTRRLRKQQKVIKETQGPNLRQREQFVALRTLLETKLRLGQKKHDDEDAQHNFLKINEDDAAEHEGIAY